MQPTLSPSAHTDTFARDHLPPPEQWPRLHFDLPELAYPQRLNCAEELLDRTIDRHGPDRPCLRGETPEEAWTYGRLRDHVDRVARVLVDDLGVRPGNRVLLRGPNSPWLAACWLAILKAGGIVVTVLPVLRSGELAAILRSARVSHALCDHRFTADLEHAAEETAAELPARTHITRYGSGEPDDLVERAARKPAGFAVVPTAADDVSLIAYTSGTTGRPKGCVHFHRDVLAIADTFSAHVLRPRPDDVFAGSPPFAFTFGLGGLLVFPMRAGASSLLLEKAGPDRLARAVAEDRVTVLFTAPTAYRAILASGASRGEGALRGDLASLRRCVSAGEHLPAATWRAWRDATGVRIIDGIGATEMLHIFLSAADDAIRPGATGVAVPGFTAAVLDDNGAPVPDGQPGRLAVRGPVGCRYLADDRQLRYVQHGWNITGDTYVRDADGYFWYQSRSDDMIVSAGYNIAATEVEEALMRSPLVREAAVVGVPDEERGQVVKAFVVPADDAPSDDATAETLKAFVKSEIAPYKTPRVVEFIAALPRTETGKLQRYKLRESG